MLQKSSRECVADSTSGSALWSWSLQVLVHANKGGKDSAVNTDSYSEPSQFAQREHNPTLEQSSHASETPQDNRKALYADAGCLSNIAAEAVAAAEDAAAVEAASASAGSAAVLAATAATVAPAAAAALAAATSQSDNAFAQSAFAGAAAGFAKFAEHLEGIRYPERSCLHLEAVKEYLNASPQHLTGPGFPKSTAGYWEPELEVVAEIALVATRNLSSAIVERNQAS